MLKDYARVEEEVARGRLWRAKEILAGRLAQADYDIELFNRYATVLHAMGDDDAAGRYYFLGGSTTGAAGELARRFLTRRGAQQLNVLWATMPSAARRVTAGSVPEPAITLLREIGHSPEAVEKYFASLSRKSARRLASRHNRGAARVPQSLARVVAVWLFLGFFILVLVLGFSRFVEILAGFYRHLF